MSGKKMTDAIRLEIVHTEGIIPPSMDELKRVFEENFGRGFSHINKIESVLIPEECNGDCSCETCIVKVPDPDECGRCHNLELDECNHSSKTEQPTGPLDGIRERDAWKD